MSVGDTGIIFFRYQVHPPPPPPQPGQFVFKGIFIYIVCVCVFVSISYCYIAVSPVSTQRLSTVSVCWPVTVVAPKGSSVQNKLETTYLDYITGLSQRV